MKILFLLISAILFNCSQSVAQQLSHIVFSSGSVLSSFSFTTDQGVVIRISEDGKLLEWGMETDKRRYNHIPGQLDPYMGRVDYFGSEGDSISKGKIKSIGTCMFSYYGAYEQPNRVGKLRSVGAVQLDYYNLYDNAAYKGKIRSANNQVFSWYASFDNEAIRGKLKSVNNTPIVYYTSFDDKLLRGKIKSIGNFGYTWYASYDRREWQGAMKAGLYEQYINGITYLVR